MILSKVAAQNTSSQASRALSLLMEEMAVWYPAPYYDIGAMLSEEAKGLKSNCRPRIKAADAKRSKNKKSLGASSAVII